MSLERFDAVEKLQTIRQQLDELARRFSRELFEEWIPAMDIVDEGRQYRIFLDVPGIKNEDLELQEDGQTITLAGVRYAGEGDYTHKERQTGQFRRTITLPEAVQAGSAQASLKSGVLEVVLKKASKKRRK